MISLVNSFAYKVAYVGILIQNNVEYDAPIFYTSLATVYFVQVMIFLVFYPIAIIICFRAYREFKGMLFD